MAASDPVTALANVGSQLIDRFWPDQATKDAAKLELFKAQQAGDLAVMAAENSLVTKQIDVNMVEAASPNLFVSGWRPFIGWICGAGLAYQFLVYPILIATIPKIVQLDMGTLLTLLGGLLGLAGMRTTEKIKGVA